MFGSTKKKKRPEISGPTNFEHRVHTGFDHDQGTFVGLPPQWQSVVNPSGGHRPVPIVDPSYVTPMEMQMAKTHVSVEQGFTFPYDRNVYDRNVSELNVVKKLSAQLNDKTTYTNTRV